jgi:adenylate kinase family enzyme
MKIAIAGSPKAGKTTVAKNYSRVIHTDDYIHLGWSEASEHVSNIINNNNFDVIEGVAVPRAIRKWLNKNSNNKNKPFDKIIYMQTPRIKLSDGQERMRKGELKVWNEIKNELKKRCVEIEEK